MEPTGQLNEALTVEVKQLIKTSRNYEDAGAGFCALGPEAISILCSIVQAEGKRRSRLRWFFLSLNLLGPLINLILIAALPKGIREPYQFLTWGIAGIGAFGNVFLVSYGGRATKLLASLNDVRVVGPLLDAVTANYDNDSLKVSMRYSLSRLLPRLQSSDVSCLLPRHITALNAEIDFCRAWKWGTPGEVAYTLIVLKALEQVGDETSLPVVEKVFASVRHQQVREAAEACLPFLQARTVMGKNTLLRATSSDTTHLLLPARRGEGQGADVLLRPRAAELTQMLPEDEMVTRISAGQ